MANNVTSKKKYTGRQEIFTSHEYVTRDNIVEILSDAITIHETNRLEIEYLRKYRNGDTPIYGRVKDIRPEINNMISENRADEIVNFKTGYLVGEPIQYVTRKSDDAQTNDEIVTLNELMDSESRDTRDIELCDWLHVCGIGYKMAFPKESSEDEAPFEISIPSPADTFVVKSSRLGHKPVLGVHMVTVQNKGITQTIYSCYAKNKYFEVIDGLNVVNEVDTVLDMIPIIEYRLNSSYLGAFEIVLPLLDAINTTQSNRLDGVEQFVQALMVIKNADIDEDSLKNLKEFGAIKLPEGSDIDYLVQQLSQSDTKSLVDGLYTDVLTICGMPNRNGGSSTSDTGTAVVLRDGWSDCEARAKTSEKFFKESERQFLKLILKISNFSLKIDSLKYSDIDIRFTRRNYENISSKTTVLTQMLGCDMIHPKLAFEHCGLFSDPSLAYEESKKYHDEVIETNLKQLEDDFNKEGE